MEYTSVKNPNSPAAPMEDLSVQNSPCEADCYQKAYADYDLISGFKVRYSQNETKECQDAWKTQQALDYINFYSQVVLYDGLFPVQADLPQWLQDTIKNLSDNITIDDSYSVPDSCQQCTPIETGGIAGANATNSTISGEDGLIAPSPEKSLVAPTPQESSENPSSIATPPSTPDLVPPSPMEVTGPSPEATASSDTVPIVLPAPTPNPNDSKETSDVVRLPIFNLFNIFCMAGLLFFANM